MKLKLDAIGIVSTDLKKSVEFYRLLGVEFPDPTGDHLEAETATGIRLRLDSVELTKKIDPSWVKPVGQGITLGFLCESPQKVDEAFRDIISAGFKAKKAPWDAFWGQRYASVIDPDGNAVDLFASL